MPPIAPELYPHQVTPFEMGIQVPEENPLLQWKGDLPPYNVMATYHVEPAIENLMVELEKQLTDLESLEVKIWEDLMVPFEKMLDRLHLVWGVISHLQNTRNSEKLRRVYELMEVKIVHFSNRLGQSEPLFQKLCLLAKEDSYKVLTPAQKRILESSIRHAEHQGVGLKGEQRERFNQIAEKLANLSTEFSNNVLDSIKNYKMVLTQTDEIDGLPESFLAQACEKTREGEGENPLATPEKGPWTITLDRPSYIPFMQFAKNREKRKELFEAFHTIGANEPNNNAPLIDKILKLRREKAKLLGFKNFADLSLSQKMAPGVKAVTKLLNEIRAKAKPVAQKEFSEISQCARANGFKEDLKWWDFSFWSERYKEEKFQLNSEEIKPYFPLPSVLKGLFNLAHRLFNITVIPADGETPVWHKDVRFFRVQNEKGKEIAAFFLDPYSRPSEKRGGAWMDELYGRSSVVRKTGSDSRNPVGYIICNQSPPIKGKPSLMNFNEVITLFHEFGHCLQHMLTTEIEGLASGIKNVEWDAVEIASQFMENWCFHPPTLKGISCHFETGEPIPDKYIENILLSKTFLEGCATVRQLNFSLLDLQLHSSYDPDSKKTPFQLQKEISTENLPIKPWEGDRFLCGFLHIFAGGYSAGYFSYKWAEVLSADVFAAFEEVGMENHREISQLGLKYRDTFLALGGGVHPMKVFERFRGREPSTKALMRHCGF